MTGLSAQDHWDIRQLLSVAVHIADSGEWGVFEQVFAADAELEAGEKIYRGAAGAASFERAERGPAIHARHTLNTVIRGGANPDQAYAWSRYLLVTEQQTALGGDLLDELVRGEGGWRIQHRRVTERNRVDDGTYRSDEGEKFATWLAAP